MPKKSVSFADATSPSTPGDLLLSPVWTVKQLADFLHISVNAANTRFCRRSPCHPPGHKRGSRVYYLRDEVISWLKD